MKQTYIDILIACGLSLIMVSVGPLWSLASAQSFPTATQTWASLSQGIWTWETQDNDLDELGELRSYIEKEQNTQEKEAFVNNTGANTSQKTQSGSTQSGSTQSGSTPTQSTVKSFDIKANQKGLSKTAIQKVESKLEKTVKEHVKTVSKKPKHTKRKLVRSGTSIHISKKDLSIRIQKQSGGFVFTPKDLDTKSLLNHLQNQNFAKGKYKYAQFRESLAECYDNTLCYVLTQTSKKQSKLNFVPYLNKKPIFTDTRFIRLSQSGHVLASSLIPKWPQILESYHNADQTKQDYLQNHTGITVQKEAQGYSLSRNTLEPSIRLAIFDPKNFSAYKVELSLSTQDILSKHEMLSFFEAPAYIYDESQNITQIQDLGSQIPLQKNGDTYIMSGSNTFFASGTADNILHSTGFTNTANEIRKATPYASIEKGISFFQELWGSYTLQDTLGIVTNSEFASYYFGGDVSLFNPITHEIHLGSGSINMANYFSVVLHEFTHAVLNSYAPITLDRGEESMALAESYADYFAANLKKSPIVGTGTIGVRNLESELTHSCYKTLDYYKNYASSGEIAAYSGTCDLDFDYSIQDETNYDTQDDHQNSLIVSGVLWELRSLIGTDTFNSLLWEALSYHPDTFASLMYSMLLADDNDDDLENGTPHSNAITMRFYKHGIGDGPAALSGETTLSQTETDRYNQILFFENPDLEASYISPENNYTNSGHFGLSFSVAHASDPNMNLYHEVWVDSSQNFDSSEGTAEFQLISSNSWAQGTRSVDTSNFALDENTTYYWQARARSGADSSAGYSTWTNSGSPRSFVIDTIAKSPFISINSGAKYTNNLTVNLSLTGGTDEISGSPSEAYYIWATNTKPSSDDSGWQTEPTSFTFSGTSEGKKEIFVWTKDNLDNISPTGSGDYFYGENIGYIDRQLTLPNGSGYAIEKQNDHLWGYSFGETIGWILAGMGLTSDQGPYTNTSSGSFGVNRNTSPEPDPITGEKKYSLTGYAWSEHIGYINMAHDNNGCLKDAENQTQSCWGAYMDNVGELQGYGYSEQAGFVRLDPDVPGYQSIIYDATKPSTPNIVINSGAAATNTQSVSINITNDQDDNTFIPQTPGYYISETWSTPDPNAEGWDKKATGFTLSSDDGIKTIYVWTKDLAQNISARGSGSILYDATPPPSPNITINSGNAYTYSEDVFIDIQASDPGSGIDQTGYYVSEQNTKPWSGATGFTTNPNQFSFSSASIGKKTVYTWVKDKLGYVSAAGSGSIYKVPFQVSKTKWNIKLNMPFSADIKTERYQLQTYGNQINLHINASKPLTFHTNSWQQTPLEFTYRISTDSGTSWQYLDSGDDPDWQNDETLEWKKMQTQDTQTPLNFGYQSGITSTQNYLVDIKYRITPNLLDPAGMYGGTISTSFEPITE